MMHLHPELLEAYLKKNKLVVGDIVRSEIREASWVGEEAWDLSDFVGRVERHEAFIETQQEEETVLADYLGDGTSDEFQDMPTLINIPDDEYDYFKDDATLDPVALHDTNTITPPWVIKGIPTVSADGTHYPY